jgi:hypothetical protein
MKRNWLSVIAIIAVVLSVWGGLPAQKARAAGTIYVWNQTGTASWATATNWTPTRTTPAATDIVQFSGGGTITVTNIPAQTVGQLSVSNNTTVNLQAAAANTLTIAGDTGTDLDVPSGSALNLNGASALTILVGTGATGSISGNMTCTAGLHKLNASDASGITFNSGAVLTQGTGCTGNIFTNAGTANAIVFASGSTFVFQIGSNPFGLAQPNSKVVFQTGSLYRHESTNTPSFSGRTYANFELNSATANLSGTGSGALSIDNLTITAGTLSLGMTGTLNLKGNISVASGTTLNFNPGIAMAITLNGTASQAISGTGTLTFAANAGVAITNPAGVSLQRNVAFSGPVTVTAGALLNANGNSFTAGTLVNNGTLQQALTIGASANDVKFLEITNGGAAVVYHGVEITNTVATSMDAVTVTIKGNQDCTTNVSTAPIKRCFNITPTTPQIADIKLWYTAGEANGNPEGSTNVYHWSTLNGWELLGGLSTSNGGGADRWVQATATAYSPFLLDDPTPFASPLAVTMHDLNATTPASTDVAAWMFLSFGGLIAALLLYRRATRSTSN